MRRRVTPLLSFLSLTLSGCGLLFMHGLPPGKDGLATAHAPGEVAVTADLQHNVGITTFLVSPPK